MIFVRHRILIAAVVATGLAGCLGCQKNVDPQQELLAQLQHPEPGRRLIAGTSIREMRPVPELFIRPLMEALNDQDASLRCLAAESLGEVGPIGHNYVNELVKIANNHFDHQVREKLQQSIQKISDSK